MIHRLIRAAACGGAFLTTAAIGTVAPKQASAGTEAECLAMGDELLAAKRANNQGQVLDVSRKIVAQCDFLGMSSLTQHFHKIGQDGLAMGAADACVETYPQEILCWMTKAAQHVHQRQASEAEDAYKHALALEKDPGKQHVIEDLLEKLRRIKRREEIFGH